MANQENQTRKPTHDVCHVKDNGKDKKGYWTTIGAAWLHEDKQGLNVVLDFLPVNSDGRLVIRVRKDKNELEGR